MVDTLNLNLVPDDSEEEFIVDFGEVINVGGGGTSDFNELTNRPKYDGQTMTGDTDIPKVPTTTSDLENTSDYQTGTEVQTAIDTAIAGKQDTLTAGDNITIQNNVISATDTTYTAGNAITIDENNVIGADIYPADYFTAGGTVTDTGSSFTLDKTIPATLKSVKLYGDTEQDGEPAPDSPVAVEVVTGAQTINVNGKNLWGGITQYYRNTSGIDFTSYADGTITASGTATANAYSVTSSGALGVGVYINLPAGTYTLSEQNNRGIQVIEAKSGGVILADTGTANVTFTLTEAEDIAVRAYITNGTAITGTITFYPMLEKNSSVTSYVPYQSQTYTVNLGSYEFCKIGDYQDYIYKSGDNWYWHKEIDKTVLDGSEDSWNRASIFGGDKYRFHVNVPDIKTTTSETEVGLVISNKLVEITNTAQYNGTQGIRVRSNGSPQLILYIDDTSTMDVDSFKTWLSSNNIICYYALATSTDTQITDAVLVSQLDLLYGASSYDEQTNFTVTATNLPAILNVAVYRKSLDGTIGAINKITDKDTTYTAGANIQISSSNVISATDTTYSAFVGTDGVSSGSSGLVPAPATTDAGKFLKADGTWDTAGGGGSPYNVYSTVTTSNSNTGGAIYLGNLNASQEQFADPTTTDGHKKYFWALPSDNTTIPNSGTLVIGGRGYSNASTNFCSIGIGSRAGSEAVALGTSAQALGSGAVSIGYGATDNNHTGSISLGWGAKTTRDGEMNIGTYNSSFGYNNTNYRVIGGLHDGQEAHDAATVAQGNTLATSAPTTSTVGVLGQLYTDTTTMHTYQCTDTTGGVYTWTQRW